MNEEPQQGPYEAAQEEPHEGPLVVVLGASGYIGSAVAAVLAEQPVRLRLVARRACRVPSGAVAAVEAHRADLTEPGAVPLAVAGADVVIHLVAYISGAATWRAAAGDTVAERTNVGLMHDVLAALRSSRRPGGRPPVVVFAGTTSQVGRAGRIDGTEPDEPVSVYARQKLDAERALKAATAEGVVRGVSLRLPTVYGQGPGVPGHGVVTAMVRRALAGEPLTVWNEGAMQRDLVHVTDVARAVAACLEHADALAGRHWLVGTGSPVTVAGLFTAIAESVSAGTGRPPVRVVSVPAPDTATAADFRGLVVDSSEFRSVTGWQPRLRLREALGRLVTALA
ncbi:NAD-dependent epimerase/dehydratase [Streptomyces sp. NPDC013178]|uniref:NAD-dependent epimerase/dehydratase family protein n=1 Tax=Streptomyces sp. NPDC013178 TaxID=3155118 RepID=UPI0033CB2DF2